MAYGNVFPANYYPMQMPQPMSPTPMSGASNGMIWVQGEAGAKSYLVAPNSTTTLWDSEAQTIYIKSADASGMPSMKVLDYTIRDAVKSSPAFTPQDANNYVTKDELIAFEDKIKKQISEVLKNADE